MAKQLIMTTMISNEHDLELLQQLNTIKLQCSVDCICFNHHDHGEEDAENYTARIKDFITAKELRLYSRKLPYPKRDVCCFLLQYGRSHSCMLPSKPRDIANSCSSNISRSWVGRATTNKLQYCCYPYEMGEKN
jgi:hypothetical protein